MKVDVRLQDFLLLETDFSPEVKLAFEQQRSQSTTKLTQMSRFKDSFIFTKRFTGSSQFISLVAFRILLKPLAVNCERSSPETEGQVLVGCSPIDYRIFACW